MPAWLNRLWANANEMPGPVWVFGAWAISRFAVWVTGGASLTGLFNCSMSPGSMGLVLWSFVVIALNQLLPLLLLWLLLYRKPFCVSLASLYIGMKGVSMFLAIIVTTTHTFNPPFDGIDFDWVEQNGLSFVAWFVICAAFLFYLERSEVVARVFPGEQNRRLPWWAYIVALVLLAVSVI